MEYIVTYSGEKITPIEPNISQIHIEDIAHSLSMLCRANGHIDRFFSIAQHSINCANEAKARGFSTRVQLACLIHDGSEAYISDITRPVKHYLTDYKIIEKRLQDIIYLRFLGTELSDDEFLRVNQIDNDLLINEFDVLCRNKEIIRCYRKPVPTLLSTPNFDTRDFSEVETEFLKVYYGIMHAGLVQGR
ncbi:MAG: phosphohydrolase [Oscillospiraceae bacterium]|jgi:hypothetical protein|nr:phosphohydrolase [Oscillospiraceae bacterium]